MLLRSRRDTVKLGASIAEALEPGDLVLLLGDLGAGKTFLARSILRAAGVEGDTRIGSPTFSLVHEYETARHRILHVDLYRLREGATPLDEEVRRLGLRDERASGAVLIVEWGHDAENALGGNATLRVEMRAGPQDSQRDVTLTGARASRVSV